MSCKWSKGTSGPAGDEHHNLICTLRAASPHANSEAQGIHTISQYGNIAGTLMKRHDSSPCADRGMTVIGFHGSQSPDSSEEREESVGLNHEQEICIAIHPHCIGRSPSAGPQGKEYLTDGSAYTMDTKGTQAIAIRTAQTSSNGNGISEELAHTLDSANGQAVAFAQNQLGEVRIGNICGTLNRNSNGRGHPSVLASVASPHGNANGFKVSPTITQQFLGGAVPQKNALTGLGTRPSATQWRFQSCDGSANESKSTEARREPHQ